MDFNNFVTLLQMGQQVPQQVEVLVIKYSL